MADVATSLKEATEKMNKAVEVAKDDFGAIRTGRAHPGMFNKIMVDYYGTYTALSQLASIQIPENRLALVSPFDKGAMASIEKAIRESDLGVNPASDGSIIRVALPQLTEERRKTLRAALAGWVQRRYGVALDAATYQGGIEKRRRAHVRISDRPRRSPISLWIGSASSRSCVHR